MGYIVDREYNVHYYEIDYKKRCLVTSLMNYFQDLAILQSDQMGVGIDYLAENKLAWVLYRWDINIGKYPMYGDKVKVRTYAYSFVKFYAYRKFEVIDNSGDVVVSADTVWLLINTDTKRPVKINEHMYKSYGISSEDSMRPKFEDLEKLSRCDITKEFEVRYSDIDTNRHVNNVKYVDWAIETMPIETILDYELKKIKVTYKKEATYGESIKVFTQISPRDESIICTHKIVDSENKELCNLETIWVK